MVLVVVLLVLAYIVLGVWFKVKERNLCVRACVRACARARVRARVHSKRCASGNTVLVGTPACASLPVGH
jgi:hypothetical protein